MNKPAFNHLMLDFLVFWSVDGVEVVLDGLGMPSVFSLEPIQKYAREKISNWVPTDIGFLGLSPGDFQPELLFSELRDLSIKKSDTVIIESMWDIVSSVDFLEDRASWESSIIKAHAFGETKNFSACLVQILEKFIIFPESDYLVDELDFENNWNKVLASYYSYPEGLGDALRSFLSKLNFYNFVRECCGNIPVDELRSLELFLISKEPTLCNKRSIFQLES